MLSNQFQIDSSIDLHMTSTGKDLDRKRESASRTSKDSQADSGVGVSSTEKRFAYSLLEKLLEYVDKAALNLNQIKPSTNYSRRNSYSTATEDVKFFGKVCFMSVFFVFGCV